MIELKNVSKGYAGKCILRDFNLQVSEGERVILFGPSGSGKTTILRMMAGFLAPDSGSVSFNGLVASHNGRILVPPEKRGLGYVFQDLALWPHMPVFENVEFVLKANHEPSGARREATLRMLRLVELESRCSSFPSHLSGGEQQRVAIARALVGKPDAVLMDEPLSSLDDDLRASLCARILDLQSRLRFALVYVSHHREEMRMLGGRPVILGSSTGLQSLPAT